MPSARPEEFRRRAAALTREDEASVRIVRRIPNGWGIWISCAKGWYPLLGELDCNFAAIDPE